MYDVAFLVLHEKAITAIDVQKRFPGRTLYQVQKALQNAAQKKLVACVRRGNQAVWGPPGIEGTDYKIPPKPKWTPTASVWELGTPREHITTQTGTVHRPLGD